MKRASISEAKNSLSALIDRVKGGSSIVIVDRGRPVARLEGVTVGGGEPNDDRLSRLVREGIVRPARAPLARTLFTEPPPRAKGGVSIVDVLIEERREGR